MAASILIVSVDDVPIQISRFLEQQDFSCFSSRGGLKTRETLKAESIDAIIWIFLGHERALAKDLLKIFNKHPQIPVILITQSYDELDFAEDIKGLFANLDLNDDLDDLLTSIETAIYHPSGEAAAASKPAAAEEPPEIEFRNVMSHMRQDANSSTNRDNAPKDESLRDVTLWNAVDEQEKRALTAPYKTEKKGFLSRLKEILD